MEPEDYKAGLSLYGDIAAHFASSDGSEVLSVVIRPSNQLKIIFLEAKDITDLGSLEAAKIFVPGGPTLYSARTINIKEEEDTRTYYFSEFGRDEQHVALVAAINSGKVNRDGNYCWSNCARVQMGQRWCEAPFSCYLTNNSLVFCQSHTSRSEASGAASAKLCWLSCYCNLKSELSS